MAIPFHPELGRSRPIGAPDITVLNGSSSRRRELAFVLHGTHYCVLTSSK